MPNAPIRINLLHEVLEIWSRIANGLVYPKVHFTPFRQNEIAVVRKPKFAQVLADFSEASAFVRTRISSLLHGRAGRLVLPTQARNLGCVGTVVFVSFTSPPLWPASDTRPVAKAVASSPPLIHQAENVSRTLVTPHFPSQLHSSFVKHKSAGRYGEGD
jgi:hypothetical protein